MHHGIVAKVHAAYVMMSCCACCAAQRSGRGTDFSKWADQQIKASEGGGGGRLGDKRGLGVWGKQSVTAPNAITD